ncbi:probable methionine--tRNA ligase [Tanacetum coccineum]
MDEVVKVHRNNPHIRDTHHLFLELPLLKDKLEKYKSTVEGSWSENAIHATDGWLKEGLRQRCITRDLKWGVPVPHERFKDKVFYVWFDASIGYILITSCYTVEWWKNPKDVELYQFMGKDNVPFHTIMFPSTLLGTDENWTLLKTLSVTEYLNSKEAKFSKSKGVGVFGNDAKETHISVEGKDTDPVPDAPGADAHPLYKKFEKEIGTKVDKYVKAMDKVKLKKGLKAAMEIAGKGNAYLQEAKFWNLYREDLPSCSIVMKTAVGLVYLLACLLEPFMPSFSVKVLKQLALPLHLSLSDEDVKKAEKPWELVPAGHKIGILVPLFTGLVYAVLDCILKIVSGEVEICQSFKVAERRCIKRTRKKVIAGNGIQGKQRGCATKAKRKWSRKRVHANIQVL